MGIFNFFKNKNNTNINILEQNLDKTLFSLLKTNLIQGWEEIVFFAGYYKDDNAYFKYWVKNKDNKYIDCFTLIPAPNPGEKDVLQEQFSKINIEIKKIRNELRDKNKWVCMEMTIYNNGKIVKKYDYADGVEKENLLGYVEKYKNLLNEKYQ